MTATTAAVTVETGRSLAAMTTHRYRWERHWHDGYCDYPKFHPHSRVPGTAFADFDEDIILIGDLLGGWWGRCGTIAVWTSPKTKKEYCRLHADASGRLT